MSTEPEAYTDENAEHPPMKKTFSEFLAPTPPISEDVRTSQAHTFLSEREKDKLIRLAWRAGMSQSGYLRMLLNAVNE